MEPSGTEGKNFYMSNRTAHTPASEIETILKRILLLRPASWCGRESFNSTEGGSKNEVAIKSWCDGDGEPKAAHDDSKHAWKYSILGKNRVSTIVINLRVLVWYEHFILQHFVLVLSVSNLQE